MKNFICAYSQGIIAERTESTKNSMSKHHVFLGVDDIDNIVMLSRRRALFQGPSQHGETSLCFERQKGQQCAYFFCFQKSNQLQNHRSPLTGTVHLAVSMEE